MLHGVGEGVANFFARVEDVLGIEDMLDLGEDTNHFFTVHFF